MTFTLVTPPADSVVSLGEAKRHLRVDHDDDDDVIQLYIGAVVSHLDGPSGWLRRALAPQEWAETFPALTLVQPLGLAPVMGVTGVTYRNPDGVTVVVDPGDYSVIGGTIVYREGFQAPDVATAPDPVTITYESGYDEVPGAIRSAVLLMVADLYANREAKVASSQVANPSARMLLDPYRRGWAS